MIYLISFVSAFLVIIFHYEVLNGLTILLDRKNHHKRIDVFMVMFGILCAHLVEACLFAVTYWLRAELHGHEAFNIKRDLTAFDYYYYSLETYTSLGYGDLYIIGPGRFLSSLEAVIGLLLIGWSSSFILLVMSRIWEQRSKQRQLQL